MLKDRITAEELKAALRSHPGEFCMNSWGRQTDCGTAFCVAGWTLKLAGYKEVPSRHYLSQLEFYIPSNRRISEVAMELLGLTSDDLFYDSYWPNELQSPEGDAPDVELACRAIDYYMEQEKR